MGGDLASSGGVKFDLQAIELPLLVEDGRTAALVRSLQRLTAEGTAHLTPGTFTLSTGDIITFPEDTSAQFACELHLSSEAAEEGLKVWPRVEEFSVTFSQPLEVIQKEGTPASLTAFQMGSDDAALSNSVEVQLRDTIGLAFAKLTSQPLPESTSLEDPLELVRGLEVPELRLELVEDVLIELEGQELHLLGGSLEVRDLDASRPEGRAEATIRAALELGVGTVFSDGKGRLEAIEGELRCEVYVAQTGDELTIVSKSSADEEDGIQLKSARLVTPDGGDVQIAPSSLRLRHLSWSPDDQLRVGVDGAAAIRTLALAFGPVDLKAKGGRIGAVTAEISGLSTSEASEEAAPAVPSVRVQDIELEDVELALSGDQALELRASRMSLSEGRSEAGHLPIRSENTELRLSEGSGQALAARSSGTMTLTLETPQALVLGEDASADGLEISAQWERLEVEGPEDTLTIEPAGLELKVVHQEPVALEVTIHSAQTTVGKFEEGLKDSTLRLALDAQDESGSIAVSSEVPYALLSEVIRSELPEVVRAEVPESFAEDLSSRLKGYGGSVVKKVAGRLGARLELSGHDKLHFESTGKDGLRIVGSISVVAVLSAQLGGPASKVLSGTQTPVDPETGAFEVIRKRFSVPLRGGVAVETTAPALLPEIQLAVRLQPDPPSDADSVSGLLASILAEGLSERPLMLSLSPLLQTQLPFEAERVRIQSATLRPEAESIHVDIAAEHLGR